MIVRILQPSESYTLAGSRDSGAGSSAETDNVPPRCSVAEGPTANHRPSSSVESEAAAAPSGTVCSMSLLVGSIATTVSSSWLPTQSDPPAAARAFGPCPTGIVASTRPVEGSRRVTVPSRWLATQTEPNVETTDVGPLPTCEVKSMLSPVGSTRATEFGATETHTPSGVKVTPDGRPARATSITS